MSQTLLGANLMIQLAETLGAGLVSVLCPLSYLRRSVKAVDFIGCHLQGANKRIEDTTQIEAHCELRI